jgi:peptidoglycan/LPS O-acetylase OafA/YrhL
VTAVARASGDALRTPRARSYASLHLDAVRGVAALAVVIYHIRYNFFLDYADVAAHTVLDQAFYVVTSYGHDAVMIFFVLSGYLISGTILKDLGRRDWSWGRYLLHRLVRLYVVLIPGLLLTLFWDSLGLRLFPLNPAYTGAPQAWTNDFFRVQDRLTPKIFFANVGFLHAIAGIPPFGTAGQLWSLTYEFAYYLICPAALLAVWPTTSWPKRIVSAGLALAFAYHFGTAILLRFPIWLLGLLVRFVPQAPILERVAPLTRNWTAAGLALLGISLTHTGWSRSLTGGSIMTADYIVGVLFTVALYVLLHDRRTAADGMYTRLAGATAAFSYTLYVAHMSLLVFLRAATLPGRPWVPTPQTIAAAAPVFGAVLAYAGALWWLTEARTDQVRAFVAGRLVAVRARLAQDAA